MARASITAASVGLIAIAFTPALHWPLASGVALAFFSHVCHQDPARSFWLCGVPIAVCARCLGIYAGAALGVGLSLRASESLRFLMCAALVNLADLAAETGGLHGNWMHARLLLGGIMGVALGSAMAAEELPQLRSPGTRIAPPQS